MHAVPQGCRQLCGSHSNALPPHQILTIKKEVSPLELDFLLRFPFKTGIASPVDFLQSQGWGGIKVGPEFTIGAGVVPGVVQQRGQAELWHPGREHRSQHRLQVVRGGSSRPHETGKEQGQRC